MIFFKKIRNRYYYHLNLGKLLLIFLGFILLYIIIGHNGIIDNYSMNKKLFLIKEFNKKLIQENNFLKQEIILLRNNIDYIEKIAKHELGMIHKGDIIYKIKSMIN